MIRKFAETEINLELDYKIEAYPIDEYGRDIEDSKSFTETKEHVIKVHCKKNELECS